MSLIVMIMATPFLSATGVYNPHVMDRHGNCTASPGGMDALYCSAPKEPGKHAYKHSNKSNKYAKN
jgi:hypothetical protein